MAVPARDIWHSKPKRAGPTQREKGLWTALLSQEQGLSPGWEVGICNHQVGNRNPQLYMENWMVPWTQNQGQAGLAGVMGALGDVLEDLSEQREVWGNTTDIDTTGKRKEQRQHGGGEQGALF